jgi:hypothetical protein
MKLGGGNGILWGKSHWKLEISNDGEGGIRTHGGVTPTPVFETGLFNRSSTSPQADSKVILYSVCDGVFERGNR